MAGDLIVLPGAAGVDFDAQEREAWAIIARAAEEALASLHPVHPERHEFLRAVDACRCAAGEAS